MAKRYRIFPGIGIARVGNSLDGMFLAAEIPGGEPIELNGGQPAAFTGYKDKDERAALKRQGSRFRIFEYETDAAGERLVREITSADAVIEWRVQLANTKAAGRELTGNRVLHPDGPDRNGDANRADLAIAPVFPSISGANQRQAEAPSGRFRGRDVKIGELMTDAEGRLIVLGGHGVSASHPNPSTIVDFANNPDWFDDVADGPVDATITFPGQSPVDVEFGSWVIVAPPDYAPPVQGLASLYDAALSAAAEANWSPPPTSYQRDVLPILQRALNLRWVQKYAQWNSFPKDFALLGTTGGQADAARAQLYTRLMNIETSGVLSNFNFTRLQKHHLEQWKIGLFVADYDPQPPPPIHGPEMLNRAALEPCVGGGWYPGIEAGVLLTTPTIYVEPCRLTRQPFADRGQAVTPGPGFLTERMACPWQADFLKCAGAWWPAQRPDRVFAGLPPAHSAQVWDAGIADHEDLVENFWKLGLVAPGGQDAAGLPAFFETERNPNIPRVA